MKNIHPLILGGLLICKSLQAQTITLSSDDTGRTFEGIGALSAGASSKLLIDYPEPYRSDILDFLFKPGFGANLYQLKVENGGDINSTDGAELAYAHTKEEFLHPKATYFNRGYEWWLIREAKKRNPAIKVEILQWGAPGWIGNGKFYSKDNANFIATYINGLKRYHDITIDYTGIRNEAMYDLSWIKLLRKTLDAQGLSHVKIDAGDQWKPPVQWQIANDIAMDPELDSAVYAINAHVPEQTDFYLPPNAAKIGKPIWSGESHASGGDWYAAAQTARINNRAYPDGKITKVIYWSLITSYPDFLTAPGSGMMKANTPWSGNYEVQPPLWMDAHLNQFARPGWKFINAGCKHFRKKGWSVITLKDSASDNYSIIIETMDAKEQQTVHFKITGSLSHQKLALWESAFKQFLFKRQADITPTVSKDNRGVYEFSLTLQPNAVYSLTTTRGQQKGRPEHAIPPATPYPGSYTDDFENDSLNRQPPYFLNYHGAFEVVRDEHTGNHYLRQEAEQQGLNWFHQPYPLILLGDSSWKDTRLSVDFLLPDTGVVRLLSRLNDFNWNEHVKGYCLEINEQGAWQLRLNDGAVLKQGRTTAVRGKWHHLQLDCIGKKISALLDRRQLVTVEDDSFTHGPVGLSTGWNVAGFDNFEVKAVK